MSSFDWFSNIETKRRKFLLQGVRQMKLALDGTVKDAVKLLKSANSNNEMVQIAEKHFSSVLIKKNVIDLHKTVAVEVAKDTFSKVTGGLKSDSEALNYFWQQNVGNYIETYGADRITLITNTTEKEFKRIVRNAIKMGGIQGLSIDKLGLLIEKNIGFSNTYRAQRIARTEIISASNKGSLTGAKSTGLQLDKIWIASKTGDTRISHKDIDGTTVDIDADFELNVYENDQLIGTESMEAAGDIRGSAGNVINCRCTVGYKRKN